MAQNSTGAWPKRVENALEHGGLTSCDYKGPCFCKNKAKNNQTPARKKIKFEEMKQPGGENPQIQLQCALQATIDEDSSD